MREDLKVTVYDRMTDPEFVHTKGWLRGPRSEEAEVGPDNPVGFCVLGVVADEAVKAGVTGITYHDDEWGFRWTGPLCGLSQSGIFNADLPEPIRIWAGMSYDEAHRLMNFNDTGRVPNRHYEGTTAHDVADAVKDGRFEERD